MDPKLRLYELCWNGCVEEVLEILSSHPHLLNQSLGGDFDDPPLIIAARCGHENLCESLLQLPEIQVNIKDRFGQTALMIASVYGHTGVVKKLTNLKHLEVNEANDGETALHYACFNGRTDVVKWLVNHGNIDAMKLNREGQLAMDKACLGDSTALDQKNIIQNIIQEASTRPRAVAPTTTPPSAPLALIGTRSSDPVAALPSIEPLSVDSPLDKYIYDVFLTHDWGLDERNRNNHSRVSRINSELKKRGLNTWFDEERMRGNIRQLMAKSIAASKVVLVHVTERYRDKIEKGDSHDSCYYEFNYALTAHPGEVEVVVMEERMKDPAKWETRLRAEIGTLLYVEMWDDDPKVFERQCDLLANKIKDKIKNGNFLHIPRSVAALPVPPANNLPEPVPGSVATVPLKNYFEAWKLINATAIEFSSWDPNASNELLQVLGVVEESDLKILLDNELRQIGELLKTIPQRKFQAALNLSTLPTSVASKSDDGIAFNDAWEVIKPNNVHRNCMLTKGDEFDLLLKSYGPKDGSDLHWLTNDELLLISEYLKAVPKRRFQTAMLLSESDGGFITAEDGIISQLWELFSPQFIGFISLSAAKIDSMFEELGVESGSDLLILSQNEQIKIAELLKTIPKRKFSSWVKLSGDTHRIGNAADAWDFISPTHMDENKHKHTKDTTASELVNFLEQNGLRENGDLLWLSDSEIFQIAEYLKVVPQRKFLTAMNLHT